MLTIGTKVKILSDRNHGKIGTVELVIPSELSPIGESIYCVRITPQLSGEYKRLDLCPEITVELKEPILPDHFPVYYDYLYVCDGKVIRSDIQGEVGHLKCDRNCNEVRRCDILGRGLIIRDVINPIVNFKFQDGFDNSYGNEPWVNRMTKSFKSISPKNKVKTDSKDLEPGDIVQFKFRGVKTKFKVLGPNDVITKNCIFKRTSSSDDYNESLRYCTFDGSWYRTEVSGDLVSEHTTRVYLEQLTNL